MALALEGNPETRRRMEAAGVDVRVYAGEELSRKGDGGPTCLTRPLRARLSARSTASSGRFRPVDPFQLPGPAPGSTTGRPSRIAKAISASVPQLPPTAITASPEPATARLRACPSP